MELVGPATGSGLDRAAQKGCLSGLVLGCIGGSARRPGKVCRATARPGARGTLELGQLYTRYEETKYNWVVADESAELIERGSRSCAHVRKARVPRSAFTAGPAAYPLA